MPWRLASRDVVACRRETEMDESGGYRRQCPARPPPPRRGEDRQAATRVARALDGLHPRRPDRAIPVQPGAHYHMGGIDTDSQASPTRPVRAGSRLCSVHGANRLGGNALMETITYGPRPASTRPMGAARTRPSPVPESTVSDAERELKELLDRTEGERPWKIREELGESIRRDFASSGAASDHRAGEIIHGLRDRYGTSSSRTRATSSTPT